ncbi:MAG: hypothetical protein OXH69_03435 [Acidobacteria bacterium]|nr:hypothetical protein [Acidobacteriota bacterium]
MAAGDPTAWVGRFRSVDKRFLERVVAVWPRCLSVLPQQPDEDTITENLVNLLLSDPETRRGFHWIEYQYEPFDYTPEGTARSKGSVDMAIILDQDRDTYLAYECKRLNELRDDGRRSLAGRYVTDGLSRFVEGQYSDNLPVGCMLGYVLDGDVQYAAARVRAAIVERGQEVALDMMPRDDIAIGVATRFYSHHRRGSKGAVIEVRHALLPM